MTTTSPSAALVPVAPVFTNTERLALAGFLAGYSGLTRQAYELDLRQYADLVPATPRCSCSPPAAPTSSASPATWKPAAGARATITRRLCTIAGFYRYAVEEDLLGHSPAAHVRRPRLDYESHAVGLGPQRTRCDPGRRRARPPGRARAHLAARAERAAGVGGHQRGYREPGHRTRTPDLGDQPQGRKGGHHPTRAAHRAGDRPGHWRPVRRTDFLGSS